MIDRVVVVNDISEPKGGATALALESALALRARGLNVTYLTGDTGENPALTTAGIEIVALGRARLTASGKLRAFASGLYNPGARRLLAGWIAANDTSRTVYHVHGWAQILSPSIFSALRAVSDRTVLHAHDFFLACPNGSFSFLRSGKICDLVPLSGPCITANCDRRNYAHKLWRVARQEILRLIGGVPRMPSILVIHEAMRDFLVRGGIPSHAIEAVPNPVRPFAGERIPAENNREFLFVGRLEATKGPDLAAAAARRAGVPVRFVGDGELRTPLEDAYPELTFSGRLAPERIGEHAARARALIMPSRYPEPYGLVAAEALWSGLPVIAAETAFLTRDILATGAGAAIDPRDIEGFARCLRAVADDDAGVHAMSIAAFDRTRAIGLTPDAWIDRLLQSYEARVISSGRARAA